jgi:peptidyl-prolyl cis-trans isomerase A (cyclophilin A)
MAAKPVVPAKPVAPAKPAEPPRDPGLYAYFDIVQGTTAMGRIVIRFYEQEMPITVKNFVDLARGAKPFTDPKTGRRTARPLFNGLTFHRVIPGFMVQGGDPLGTGMGGVDAIADEFHPSLEFNKPFLLSMANAGPGTGSCQFFITTTPGANGFPSWLNGKHPIFGEVVEGQEVVDAIAAVPRGAGDRPETPVVMKSVVIRRFPLGQPIWPVAKPVAAPKPGAVKPAIAMPKKN